MTEQSWELFPLVVQTTALQSRDCTQRGDTQYRRDTPALLTPPHLLVLFGGSFEFLLCLGVLLLLV